MSESKPLLATRTAHTLLLLALSLGIYVGTAAHPALVDESDCGHAVASREILERGDWAVLHINGIRYLEKAPLHYWMVAASYALVGESAFATRLPLGLAVAGLVWIVYVFGRRFLGEQAGFYAGLMMCTSFGTFLFTRTMIPEAIYALLFTAAFYLFLRAWTGSLSPRMGYLGCAAVIGLAVLTRAIIGALFPLATLTLFMVASGGWRRLRELPMFSSALVFLLVAAPWHLIAGLKTPGFFWFYFVNEHFLRAIGARYPQDYATVPLAVWWAAHLAWFFPWSVFLPYAVRELPRPKSWSALDAGGQARLLLFCWTGFILFFFSLTKRMEYYSFGAYPAIALLLGAGLARAEEEGRGWLPRLQGALAFSGALVAAVLGGLLWVSRNISSGSDIVALLETKPQEFYRVAMANFFDLTPQAFSTLRIPAASAALLFLLGFGAAWLLRRGGRTLAANLAVAFTMAGFIFSANLAFQVFEPRLSSRNLAEAIDKHLQPEDQLVIYGDFYGGCTVSFYTQRKAWLFNGRYYGLEYGSYYPDAPKIFLSDSDFPAIWRGPQRVFLFVPEHKHGELLVRLPPDSTYVLAESGGKAVYVNRPLVPDQPKLAELRARGKL
jgi:4-amino-4-deoxy-L-arabinose transferase-like glycosyltransferase